MLIYKNGIIADYRELFKNTSFPSSGPTDDFLEQNNAKRVNIFKPHDRSIEKLVSCDPYIENGFVYTVKVELKTQEEIDIEINLQKNKIEKARLEAYRNESDPLFFKAQRGEITMDEWISKVEEIKQRYPNER